MAFRMSSVGMVLFLCGLAAGGETAWSEDPSGSGTPAPAELQQTAAPSSDLPLELQVLNSDLVYVSSATKYMKKLSEVPGSVSVITAREIRESGALNLSEVLERTCGVRIVADGAYSSIEIRGFHTPLGSKVLVLENGRILNEFEQGFDPGNFSASLDNIKQIEIIKGPSSALYGRDAYAGIVNIITKEGHDLQGLHLKASVGVNDPNIIRDQPGQYYDLAYGQRSGDWDYAVTAGYWRVFGLDTDWNSLLPNNLYDGERGEAALKYQDTLSLRAGYHRSRAATFSFLSGFDQAHQEHTYVDGQYAYKVADSSRLSFRVADTYYPLQWVTRYLVAPSLASMHEINSVGDLPTGIVPGQPQIIYEDRPPALSENAVGGYYLSAQSFLNLLNLYLEDLVPMDVEKGSKNQLLTEIKYELSWPDNNYLLAGADYCNNWSDRNVYYTPTVQDENYAGYVQDEYHLGENWIFLAGVRFDYNTTYASAVSPRLSAIYSPLPGLRFKALYGTAYRAPNDMERNTNVIYTPITLLGNRDLKPETVQQGEVGVEYEVGNWLQAKAAAYYYQTRNEITYAADTSDYYLYAPNPPLLYYNTELNAMGAGARWSNDNSSVGRGIELENKYRPWEWMSLDWNFAHWYQASQWENTLMGRANGFVNLFNGLVSFRYANYYLNFYTLFQHRPELRREDLGTETVFGWIPRYDATIGGTYQGWNLTVAVYNLTGANQSFYRGIYIPRPKVYRVNLEYTYNF
jgi:outer membrane receptor protein involved in Fe transport